MVLWVDNSINNIHILERYTARSGPRNSHRPTYAIMMVADVLAPTPVWLQWRMGHITQHVYRVIAIKQTRWLQRGRQPGSFFWYWRVRLLVAIALDVERYT